MEGFKDEIKKIINHRIFHMSVIALIVVIVIVFAVIKIFKYDVEGETKMPFELSKIELISSVTGENVPESENTAQARWNITVDQNNDFYIYINKNEEYKGREQEVISSVQINNFSINKTVEKGIKKLYKPSSNTEKEIFKNKQENEVTEITYLGSEKSNIKNLEMSNQGDLIYFRYTTKDISRYISNDEEIIHSELLKKTNVGQSELEAKITFDLTIKLVSNKSYKTTINAVVPIEGVVEKGTASKQIIDKNQLIFKRI